MKGVTRKQQEQWARDEVLNLPQWYQPMYNGYGSCPWCENFQHEGHTKDCKREIVLKILKAALG